MQCPEHYCPEPTKMVIYSINQSIATTVASENIPIILGTLLLLAVVGTVGLIPTLQVLATYSGHLLSDPACVRERYWAFSVRHLTAAWLTVSPRFRLCCT